MKVVLAVDASEQAAKAFRWYVSELHKAGNEVILLHCAERPQLTTGMLGAGDDFVYSPEMYTDKVEEIRMHTKNVKTKFEAMLKQHQLQGTVKLLVAMNIGEALCEQVKEIQPTYVVMGTRGMGAIRRTILGSVSDYILHHVHCPIIICRD